MLACSTVFHGSLRTHQMQFHGSMLLASLTLSVLRSVVDAFTLEEVNTLIQSDRSAFYRAVLWLVPVSRCSLDIVYVGVGSQSHITNHHRPTHEPCVWVND